MIYTKLTQQFYILKNGSSGFFEWVSVFTFLKQFCLDNQNALGFQITLITRLLPWTT